MSTSRRAKPERFPDARSVVVHLDRYMMRWGSKRILQFLKPNLKRFPRSPDIRIDFASALGELRRPREAYKHSARAIRARPDDPYFQWHHAGVLYKLGRNRNALNWYERIIRRGVRRIAAADRKKIPWARSLVNDARYRAAGCHHLLDETRDAHRLFCQFLNELCDGAQSEYTRVHIRRIASEIGFDVCGKRSCALMRRKAQAKLKI